MYAIAGLLLLPLQVAEQVWPLPPDFVDDPQGENHFLMGQKGPYTERDLKIDNFNSSQTFEFVRLRLSARE